MKKSRMAMAKRMQTPTTIPTTNSLESLGEGGEEGSSSMGVMGLVSLSCASGASMRILSWEKMSPLNSSFSPASGLYAQPPVRTVRTGSC